MQDELDNRVCKLEERVNSMNVDFTTFKVTIEYFNKTITKLEAVCDKLESRITKNDEEHKVNLAQLAKDNIIPLVTLLVLVSLLIAKVF